MKGTIICEILMVVLFILNILCMYQQEHLKLEGNWIRRGNILFWLIAIFSLAFVITGFTFLCLYEPRSEVNNTVIPIIRLK